MMIAPGSSAPQLDGVHAHRGPPLVLLGSAPSPAALDPAILRPGRLDVHVTIAPPDAPRRRVLLARRQSRHAAATPPSSARLRPPARRPAAPPAARKTAPSARVSNRQERMLERTPLDADVSLDDLAAATEGCSLAQLSGLCREAAMGALREDIGCARVGARHVRAALARVHRPADVAGVAQITSGLTELSVGGTERPFASASKDLE